MQRKIAWRWHWAIMHSMLEFLQPEICSRQMKTGMWQKQHRYWRPNTVSGEIESWIRNWNYPRNIQGRDHADSNIPGCRAWSSRVLAQTASEAAAAVSRRWTPWFSHAAMWRTDCSWLSWLVGSPARRTPYETQQQRQLEWHCRVVHTSPRAAAPAEMLLLNKRWVKCTQCHGMNQPHLQNLCCGVSCFMRPSPNHNRNPNLTLIVM